jgi:GT2 family glycosyltransferase
MVCMNNPLDFQKSLNSVQTLLSEKCRIIIIDSSNTSEILKESNLMLESGKNILYKWEEPQGIYHAMNTGILLADEGSLVWFLNPGDLVTEASLVLELTQGIAESESKWGYGLACYDHSEQDRGFLFPKSVENSSTSLFFGELQISHQSMLVRKEVLLEFGLFDAKFRIAADLDMQFKLLEKYAPYLLCRHLIVVDTTGLSHNQQFRTLIESAKIRFGLNEFSFLQKVIWLRGYVVNRIKVSKRLRLQSGN